jgi:hypothetical protein
MTDQSDKPAKPGRPAGPKRSPFRLLAPIALGLVVGSALYGGYYYWSHQQSRQQALAAAQGDADMARPTAEECAIARAALSAIHAGRAEKAWQTGAGVSEMSLGTDSKVINPVDVAGYSDEEADNLRSKSAADWRWCPGMTTFVSGLGWTQMGGDDVVAVLALGRPGLNKVGDEARVYEAFMAPRGDSGILRLAGGPWLATLHRGPNGAWQMTSTDALKRANP